jgi:glycosyltransferase involved in cell wall biosynthesis
VSAPRVALAHDYIVNRGGAEKVVLALHRAWPEAPIFTSLYHPSTTYEQFQGADIRTSFLQRLSRDASSFRRFLPLFGRAMSSMKIEGFDVVVASTAGFAHLVAPRGACLIAYCHTPPRFLYDDGYDVAALTPGWAKPVMPATLKALRRADQRAARRVHTYVANSNYVAERIQTIYGRRSIVINPPVETSRFTPGPPGDYYLMVGRLLPHRNMQMAVDAFTHMQRRFVVVGDGPIAAQLKQNAGPNVEFTGAIDDAALAKLYAGCRGVVVPGREDFGIAPLEANAAGKPVVALRRAGVMETVADGFNGVLFDAETPEALQEAVERAEALGFDVEMLQAHARRYDEAAFVARMRELVEASTVCMECARGRRADHHEADA